MEGKNGLRSRKRVFRMCVCVQCACETDCLVGISQYLFCTTRIVCMSLHRDISSIHLSLSSFLSLPLSVRLCVLCAHTTQSWQPDRLNFNAYDSFFFHLPFSAYIRSLHLNFTLLTLNHTYTTHK